MISAVHHGFLIGERWEQCNLLNWLENSGTNQAYRLYTSSVIRLLAATSPFRSSLENKIFTRLV
jgi:hypothetical protein